MKSHVIPLTFLQTALHTLHLLFHIAAPRQTFLSNAMLYGCPDCCAPMPKSASQLAAV
jgi:hypothetical protein